jgi:mannose-1-phosphate guanylyltransferase
MLHAVIMAGGAGTRFWPASRAARPKQLLALVGGRSLLRQTVDRLGDLVPPQRMLVVTSAPLLPAVGEQLPELPAASLVGEPCKRDTAPCIGLAALLVRRRDPDATMAVLPADHVIRAADRFRQALRQGASLVEQEPDRIVTFGIRPTYPAEIFGYIQRGAALPVAAGEAPAYVVRQFREKPDAKTAAEYLRAGDFYWNSGIFVWKARTIVEALAERQPAMLSRLEAIVADWETPVQAETFRREFAAIQGISIDYAVMEQARHVAVVEAPYDWDDLGGWQSLTRLLGVDASGNTVVGKHLGIESSGCIVRSEGDHAVVTVGLRDALVVHTPDATLVANKHDEEALRKVVRALEERGWNEHL